MIEDYARDFSRSEMAKAAAPRQAEVDESVARLFEIVEALENRAGDLEERFSRVLRPQGPEHLAKVPDVAPTGVDLADVLEGATNRLLVVGARLGELRARAAI